MNTKSILSIASLGLAFLFTQTVSIVAHAQDDAAAPAHAETAPAAEAKSNPKKNNVLTYFHQVYAKDSDLVAGFKFEDQDIRNGYLRATGDMEGYYVFSYFKAAKNDLLVQQGTGCGPACTQELKAFFFQDGKLVSPKSGDAFDKLYSKKQADAHVAAFMKKVPKHGSEDVVSWIRLPREGRAIEVLVLDQAVGTAGADTKIYRAGTLTWNGSKFDFKKIAFGKASNLKISDIY